MIVGHRGLAEQRLDDGRTEQFGDFDELVARMQRAVPGKDRDALAAIQDLDGARQLRLLGHAFAFLVRERHVVLHVAHRAFGIFQRLFLHVRGNGDVRDGVLRAGDATGQRHRVLDVRRAHDARAVGRDVGEQLRQVDVLLREGVDEIVVRQPRDRDHGGLVELGVVQAVEQVHAAGTGGREAAADAPGPLGVRAGHERGGFLVAHLDETDLTVALADGLHDAVDAITRQAKDGVHAPGHEAVDQYVGAVALHAGGGSTVC